jgi:hypothetical protein
MSEATVAQRRCPTCDSALQYRQIGEVEFEDNRLTYWDCGHCRTKVSIFVPTNDFGMLRNFR